MRSAFLTTVFALLLAGCEPLDTLPTQSTALPVPSVSLVSRLVQRDLVRIVWSVEGGDGRRFEIQRQNRQEPWKHFATVTPTAGRITLEDAGVVPGQGYVYRLRLYGTTGDAFLDEVRVAVPL